MKSEIISIGDELLIGQVVNTNSAWMAQELNKVGISVIRITAIADDHAEIINALVEASKRADIILITGGLGPTKDDVTKLALCDYFNSPLVFDQPSFDNIQRIFTLRGYTMTEINRKQAEIPACAGALLNIHGTAPGMFFRKNGKIYFSLPGVPFEMKALMSDQVIPVLQKISDRVIIHKTILTQGVGESFLADKIEKWELSLPSYIKLAYLPQPGMVRLRLSAIGTSKDMLQKEVDGYIKQLYTLVPEYIYGEDDDYLESVVGRILKEKQLTLSTAESCTGGYIAHLITSVPGSSMYFNGSVVSYSNLSKIQTLHVSPQTLEQFGAVSSETVIEMAEGAKKVFSTNCSIAVSGIAGPDGGTPDKPVGTVWIAVSVPGKDIMVRKFLFGEHRERNIRQSALAALDMLRKNLILD